MTLPDERRRYYAPWREDPRPISGLLQRTYAFLEVSAFWQRQSVNGALRGERDSEFAR